MKSEELKEMRRNITALIDDIKYHSDSLTDLDRLPVIQLKVILAKINKLTEKSTILLHYIEKQGRLSDLKTEDSSEAISSSISEENTPELKEHGDISIEENEFEDKKIKKSTNPPAGRESGLNELIVTDLFAAIGINEKYLFSGVMFGGNTDRFIESVQNLNKMDQLSEVEKYLDELSKELKWDHENETVQNFISLVERKFDQF